MNILFSLIGVSSIVGSISWIIVTCIKEKEKRKRIKDFEKMDNSKIEAIGNYEKKSKNKIPQLPICKTKDD